MVLDRSVQSAGAVLHQLLKLNRSIIYANDDAEVLPHVVADLDLVDILVGRAHQCISVLATLQRTHHGQRLQREGFQWLLAPGEVRCELACALQGLDLARAKWVGKIERVIRERLVRLDLRERIELSLDALALLLHPRFEVLVLCPAPREQRGRGRGR